MKKLSRSDIVSNEQYLKMREETRKKVIALRKLRRIEAGERLSFTFENRETVAYQIQEMMRVEHIADEQKIQHEIDVYNDLIPPAGSLSATMFIEIQDADKIKSFLDAMQGLDRPDTVFLKIGDQKTFAEFEPGHSKEDRISAVHYVLFRLGEEQSRKFASSSVELHVEHPAYKARTILTSEQRQELSRDLA